VAIVGAFDVHRAQLTYDYVSTEIGEVRLGQIRPADRQHLRAWLARFGWRWRCSTVWDRAASWTA
jgi:transposase